MHCNLTTKGHKFAVLFTVPLRDFERGEHTVVTEYLTNTMHNHLLGAQVPKGDTFQ